MNKPNTEHFKIWEKPKPSAIGNTVEEFLQILDGPALIIVPGTGNEEIRAVCTLLHGNEPSGTRAIYHWLKHGITPACTMLFFICSVKTALQPPGFYYRQLPGKRDLNRCFRPPFSDDEGKIAEELLALIAYFKPTCILDIHNTSGKGPAFAVSTNSTPLQIVLASFFTQRMIVTDLRLGALSDLNSDTCPIIAIECGGAREDCAHDLALDGLSRFIAASALGDIPTHTATFELLHNPVRVELINDLSIDYLSHKNPQVDMTLNLSIEEHNFGIVKPFHQLGWTGKPVSQCLQAINSRGENVIDQIVEVRDGELYPRRPIKLFMATTNAVIARSDCLFYVVDIDGKEITC
ncbi:MAG: succinylglutamate desuccinylase [Hahellaceae bacterium]|nr:succinylglutamate desuccinylase [Hahellaceae bacterium]MCP5210857.1 succinylglutamate desuccinylase [Hahellaceae bacterium]